MTYLLFAASSVVATSTLQDFLKNSMASGVNVVFGRPVFRSISLLKVINAAINF